MVILLAKIIVQSSCVASTHRTTSDLHTARACVSRSAGISPSAKFAEHEIDSSPGGKQKFVDTVTP